MIDDGLFLGKGWGGCGRWDCIYDARYGILVFGPTSLEEFAELETPLPAEFEHQLSGAMSILCIVFLGRGKGHLPFRANNQDALVVSSSRPTVSVGEIYPFLCHFFREFDFGRWKMVVEVL